MADLILNHVSTKSEYFKDYLDQGKKSPFADIFLTLDKFCPKGKLSQQDYSKIYRPRPTELFVKYKMGKREINKVWQSFDFGRVDLDVESSKTIELFKR